MITKENKKVIEKRIKDMEEAKYKKLKAKKDKKLYEGTKQSKISDGEYTKHNKEFKKQRLELAKELDLILKNNMAEINPEFPVFYKKALKYLRKREALNQQVYNIKRYAKTEYPMAKARYDILMKHRYEVYNLYQEYKEKAKKERKELGKKESGYNNFFHNKINVLLKIFEENTDVVSEDNIIKVIRVVEEEKDNKERKSKLVPPIRPIDALVGYGPNTILRSYCKKTDYELLSELGDELLKALYAEIIQAEELHSTESLEIFIQFAFARRCSSQTSYKGEKREKKKKEWQEKHATDNYEILTVNISGDSVETLQKKYRALLKEIRNE